MATKKRSVWDRLKGHGLDVTCYISYSHSDGRDYAERLGVYLQAEGVRLLLAPNEISAGSRLVEVLHDVLNRADVVILVGTPLAFASPWVLEEVQYFLHRGGRVVPIVFRGATDFAMVPLFLREFQWVQEDYSRLREGPSREVVSRLVEAIGWWRSEARRDHSKPTPARSQIEKHPLNEGKLILVGRGEVGKTSLVKRLVDNDFNSDESKDPGHQDNELVPSVRYG